MEQFAGFDPEIQGVYITKQADNHLAVEGFALDNDQKNLIISTGLKKEAVQLGKNQLDSLFYKITLLK